MNVPNNMKVFCILLLFVTVSVGAQSNVRLSKVSNLTYQLDCASNQQIPCSYKNVSTLWKNEFLKTETDRAMLSEWSRLRKLHNEWVRFEDKTQMTSSEIYLFEKIRIAGLQSDSVADYLRRIDLLTSPRERTGFEKVIRHFYPRFSEYWKKEVETKAVVYRRKMDSLLNSEKIAKQISAFEAFYAPSITKGYDTTFNLLYSPDLVKEGTSGQQIENYSLVEFKLDEDPKNRVDVVVHELCHFYFNSISEKQKTALKKSFFDLNRPLAMPAFNLMDESIATAFGNGMILRSLATEESFKKVLSVERSFYNNDYIDRVAKSTLPLLDTHINAGKTVHDPGFAKKYLKDVETAFEGQKLTPKVFLMSMLLIVDADLKEIQLRKLGRMLGARSISSNRGEWDEPELQSAIRGTSERNSLIVLFPQNLDGAVQKGLLNKRDVAKMKDALQTRSIVLFNKKRPNFINNYYVIVKRQDDVERSIKMLGELDQFEGLAVLR